MQAVKGYINNGRFTPHDFVKIPKRASVIVVFGEIEEDEDTVERMTFLREMDELTAAARGEVLPDFPRMNFNRGLVNLSDEG